jgi:hypothetical protein
MKELLFTDWRRQLDADAAEAWADLVSEAAESLGIAQEAFGPTVLLYNGADRLRLMRCAPNQKCVVLELEYACWLPVGNA